MTPNVVAVFACSFLSVSASLPAAAHDAAGIVERFDPESGELWLRDGNAFALSQELAHADLRPGIAVHLLYEAGAS